VKELHAIYRQALPGHIAALESARADALTPDRDAAFEKIRRIAHSLRGSGGTYGFPQISEAAAAVEGATADQLAHRLDHLIAMLSTVADGAVGNDVDEQQDGPNQAGEGVNARGSNLRGARLLIVDDDPEIRFIAGFVLRAAGCEVVEAEDSASAGAHLAAAAIDVVLMDVMLGTEDGVDAARRLLSGRSRSPRLVFLTGATRSDQLARLSATGAAGVLHKPLDPEALPAELERILATVE
jgi:CheY-like chemotaxis protein